METVQKRERKQWKKEKDRNGERESEERGKGEREEVVIGKVGILVKTNKQYKTIVSLTIIPGV